VKRNTAKNQVAARAIIQFYQTANKHISKEITNFTYREKFHTLESKQLL